MNKSKSPKPYDERTDHEKLHSSWKKARAQFSRSDWSASVARVATAAELAANIYVRRYLLDEYNLPSAFVDSLLKDANGIFGKFTRLVKPIAVQRETWTEVKKIQKSHIEPLNDKRNEVVHSGRFMNRGEAVEIFTHGLAIIKTLASAEATGLNIPN